MCSSGKEPETTLHYLLRCDLYLIYRLELLNDICALNESLKNFSEFFGKVDCFSGPLFFS